MAASDLDPLTNDDLVVSYEPEHIPGTVPVGLVLTAVRIGQGQVRIEANDVPHAQFDDAYVSLSGYVGAYNPNIFAAAPDLLAALRDAADLIERIGYREWPGGSLANLRAAIAKAEAA